MKLIEALMDRGRVWTKKNQNIFLFGELSAVRWWTPRGMYEVNIKDIKTIDYRPTRPVEGKAIALELTITNNKDDTIKIKSFVVKNMPAAIEWIKWEREIYLEQDFENRKYLVRRRLEV